MSIRRPLSFREDEQDLLEVFDSDSGGSAFAKDAMRFYLKYKDKVVPDMKQILKDELKNEIKAELLTEIITLIGFSGMQNIKINPQFKAVYDDKIINNARKSLVK